MRPYISRLSISFLLIIFGSINWISAQTWQAIPLVSQKILDAGHAGGEGAQVIEAIEVDHHDGSFMLMGTDVGGIYRSINGGLKWEPCNVGYHPRGNSGFAIDILLVLVSNFRDCKVYEYILKRY